MALRSPAPKPIQLLISDLQAQFEDLSGGFLGLQQQVNQIQSTPTPLNVPQAVNQILNGSFSHSVNSWADTGVLTDGRYECKAWFSHPIRNGQAMFQGNTLDGLDTVNFTSANVNTTNDTITLAFFGTDMPTGLAVKFSTTGTLPSPLGVGTVYYVINTGTDDIKLATSEANAIAGTAINLTSTGSGTMGVSFTFELKTTAHALYSSVFSDWSWTNPSAGCARLQGTTSVDAAIPGGNIEPVIRTYYGVVDVIKDNAYITIPAEERIFCGLYAKQGGSWDWIKAPFELTYSIIGTVTGAGVSRDYRVVTNTDRGFSIRSSILTIANAPTDTDFANGTRVVLSWKTVLTYGVQTYDIYRDTGGTILHLQTIVTGLTSTQDNGTYLSTVGAYPSATFDALVSYTATLENIVDDLPYVGDPLHPNRATLPFALRVPQDYNVSTTDRAVRQWLRFGFINGSDRFDLNLPCEATTATTITSTTGLFTADMVGLSCTVRTGGGGAVITTVATYVSATEITIAAPTSVGTGSIYITGGASSHSIYLDLAHLTLTQGAAFAPNAADISDDRGVPPVAMNGSPSGGGGVGQLPGTIDGQPVCLWEDESVMLQDGRVISAAELQQGDMTVYGNAVSEKPVRALADVWYLETESGAYLRATETKQVFTPKGKRTVRSLQVGDTVLIDPVGDGTEVPDILRTKILFKENAVVIRISLHPNEKFLAGGAGAQPDTGWWVISNNKPITEPA